MMHAMETRNLGRRFGRAVALDQVELAVPEGAVYALVGANGAGKTTLIKVLMNIVRPTAGTAQVLGCDSRRLSGTLFQKIGYVSENQQMPEWMTVESMLAYYRNFYPTWDRALEAQLVRQFNLPLDRKLKHLSRGMRMKAAFAGSMAYRPTLMVLDEPFSGLDPLVRDELIEGLIERAQEMTIFLSSHDLAEIESFASHVGFLDDGRLLSSEEMGVLGGRFREVTVTLAEAWMRPARLPKTWLQVESSGRVVQFVESHYSGAASEAEYAAVFGDAHEMELQPMTLRAIFLAIAKSKKANAAERFEGPVNEMEAHA